MNQKYLFFIAGLALGVIILYYERALPPPFDNIGYKTDVGNRIRFYGVRIHHSSIGLFGFFIASLVNPFSEDLSQLILGVSVLFFFSQLPEIITQGTLFWEDGA